MKLVRKKEVWIPTWPGFALFVLLAGLLGGYAALHIYPFLAQNHPQPSADILILEGWLPDAELQVAAAAIRPGQIVVTTGGPVTFGQKIFNYDNYADMATARLVALGVPAETIITAPAPDTLRDRTYVSAQAARRKLAELGLFGRPANLYTVGAHARRSYLMFRTVFGREYPLGVVAIEPLCCQDNRWYRYSEGFKHVLTELFSWIYAQFFLIAHA